MSIKINNIVDIEENTTGQILRIIEPFISWVGP